MTQESNHKTYRLGLALSGGGAKGFAHLGVFKLLEECGLKPDIIVGTSVGALMGTLFADGYSADELKELFTGREFSEFAQLQLPKSGLFDSKRFRYFLKRHLRAKTFEELKIPMIVVATLSPRASSRCSQAGTARSRSSTSAISPRRCSANSLTAARRTCCFFTARAC